jgi:hypothetical protein
MRTEFLQRKSIEMRMYETIKEVGRKWIFRARVGLLKM